MKICSEPLRLLLEVLLWFVGRDRAAPFDSTSSGAGDRARTTPSNRAGEKS